MSGKNILKSLGPGLLFAGAAVGVSHLVYSTKGGAMYGFGLLWLVLMANIFKYPFFEFGPRYYRCKWRESVEGLSAVGQLGTCFICISNSDNHVYDTGSRNDRDRESCILPFWRHYYKPDVMGTDTASDMFRNTGNRSLQYS